MKASLPRTSIAAILFSIATAAQATETTTYTYDARGRLTQVTKSGGPANGVTSNYTYDPADNRQNVTVTGAPQPPAVFIVVPLNGYTLIRVR